MERTITLDEIGERSASDLLREIAAGGETLRVALENGGMVALEPTAPHSGPGTAVPPLKPLTVLPGYVPAGWKDAIYDFSDSES